MCVVPLEHCCSEQQFSTKTCGCKFFLTKSNSKAAISQKWQLQLADCASVAALNITCDMHAASKRCSMGAREKTGSPHR